MKVDTENKNPLDVLYKTSSLDDLPDSAQEIMG